MRKQLEPMEPGLTLRDALVQVGLAGLESFLRPGPGFQVLPLSQDSPAEPIPEEPGFYRIGETGIVAEVSLKACPDLSAVVQQITLTNPTDCTSLPLRSLSAFYLPMTVLLQHVPYALAYGGGMTDGYYPPRAYREERVCFGLARDWEPQNASYTRWCVSKRLFRLANDENGWSSNPYLPLMLAGWQAGGCSMSLWAALEWSGRWELAFGTEKQDWFFAFKGGPRIRGLVLEPGERLRLPRVHLGVAGGPSGSDANGLNAIRRYLAEAVSPDVEGRRPWPTIAYHTWDGLEENPTDAVVRRQADRAAELGVEYFEIDAGWYGGVSEHFADGVGNWERVDETKFPGGLEPLAEYIRSKGLRFGLWFEPERARKGSDWLREHPGWFWECGHPTDFHLDLTRAEVQDGLFEMLSSWIEKLDIRWLRWDYNQPPGAFWDRVDPTGKVQFAYVEALYRVREMLLSRFPNLNIDNCASGGNRIDFGTLRTSGTMVPTDHAEDPHICRLTQTGGARVLPANYMNISFFVGEEDGDGAVGPRELISRMAGSMSLSGHIANWSLEHTADVKRYLDGYRSFRHLLMKDFYALTSYPRSDADWDVVEFIDPKNYEAVVLAYRVRGQTPTYNAFPQRLDPGKIYRICDPFTSHNKKRMVQGKKLMETGMHISLEPESAAVIHLIPIS